jgi:hypothetical protein
MGLIRNGARSFLNVMSKACKFSRMPGFTAGLESILGVAQAGQVMALWVPLCALIDTLIAADNYYNQIDFQPDHEGDEDAPGV